MRRIVNFFKEWYGFQGGALLGIPVGLAFALGLVGGLGSLTLCFKPLIALLS